MIESMKCLYTVYLTGYEDKLLKLPDIFSLAVRFGQESPKSEKLFLLQKRLSSFSGSHCKKNVPLRPRPGSPSLREHFTERC